MHWPFYEYESARDVKLSPLHDRLDAAGAVFGEMSGWERPNWYAAEGMERRYRYSYGKQNWWEASGEECLAVREAVGLFDQTSFAKFEVEGPDAARLLGWISAGRVPGPPGKVVYTQWLNARGGIEADLTVTRLSEERFLVVSGSGAPTRDWAHLWRAARGHDVKIRDITSHLTMLGVMGPRSRELLSALTDADLRNEAFPFSAAREITVAGHRVLSMRVSYVGELGWELYVPVEQALSVYEAVVAEGAGRGFAPCRVPRHELAPAGGGLPPTGGHDITDEDTPPRSRSGFCGGLGQARRVLRSGGAGNPARSAPHQTTCPVSPGRPRPAPLSRRAHLPQR